MNRRQPLLPQNQDNSQPALYGKIVSALLHFDQLGEVGLKVAVRSFGYWGVLVLFGYGVIHFIIGK